MAEISTLGILINGKIMPVSNPYKLVEKFVKKPDKVKRFITKNESIREDIGKIPYDILIGKICLKKPLYSPFVTNTFCFGIFRTKIIK